MLKLLTAFGLCIFCTAGRLLAKVVLPPLINNNMVLQQQSKVALWGMAGANTELTVNTTWNNKEYKTRTDPSGKWKIMVSTPKAGGPYEISFSDGEKITISNVMIGEVWICSGQSNMEMTFKGFGPTTQPVLNQPGPEANIHNLRLFTVKRATGGSPKAAAEGQWDESTTAVATSFSAVAYQFGKMLCDSLKVPVGMIATSWGGARIEHWMSKESLASFPEIPVPIGIDTMKVPEKAPTALFNGMIAPLLNYGIRGFLWYQGESSRDQPILYARLQPVMVADWRKHWKNEKLPFYYVEITPFTYPNDKHKMYGVLLREAQLKALKNIPHAAMAVTTDVGSELKIHPPDKTTVALRLGYIALAKTYGKKGIAYESPVYRSMKITGDKAVLRFDHAPNGLTSKEKDLGNFEIAGVDKIFYPATATIQSGGRVEVKSDKVSSPVAVRYAFKNWVVGDLFNTEGLPAPSFRTDNWDIPPFIFTK